MAKQSNSLENLRHSCAHLLASAVTKLWPGVLPTIGPVIENGFYYDFDFGKQKINEDDLPKIEKKMEEIVSSWKSFEKQEVSAEKAKEIYKNNSYKLELIDDLEKENENIILYKAGDPSTGRSTLRDEPSGSDSKSSGQSFTDLCRGGHCKSPDTELKYFKLLSVAGAYWRGDENNPMLTRIYGTCYSSKKELDHHLEMAEEAKKRDHKKLGTKLGLFMFHETSPGSPYWLPKGLVLYNELVNFWREEHRAKGYQEVASPLVNKKALWETSGHWEHFKDEMFVADMGEHEVYGLKPMNCPNAMVIFGSQTRSYKDLPLRFSDTDTLHRYERSGVLNGLFRVRSFRQDDAHNFVTEDQIESEYDEILKITDKFYKIFGLEYKLRLGTRPEKHLGKVETWDKAEKSLKSILKKHVGEGFEIAKGDGAFYGPKVDILMKDSMGRSWQMGTIQLDMQLPERFKLKYIDKKGERKMPVVIHRVIYGSLERFIGILIEHFEGAFPVWISPIQVKILPITDRNLPYATKLMKDLTDIGIRVELDEKNDTLSAKIRLAQTEKVPYMLVVGDKEEKAEKLAVRARNGKDLGLMSKDEFIKTISIIIDSKATSLV